MSKTPGNVPHAIAIAVGLSARVHTLIQEQP